MDQIPIEAAPLLQKLHDAIIQRRLSQERLRLRFNEEIAVYGAAPISRGTFNRHVMRVFRAHLERTGAADKFQMRKVLPTGDAD